jgi:nitroreductase
VKAPFANAISARDALLTRRSVRGFLATPVPRETLEAVLSLAARAPSGTNIQPWKVVVVTGAARQRISDALIAERARGVAHEGEYRYYPPTWREPYIGRRRQLGKALYTLLGIPKDDIAGRERHFARNYEFYGAPAGLFFVLDRDMEVGSWLDLGMFMQNVMIAARAFGLDTCAQQVFAQYHRLINPLLGIGDDEILVCGMSLGYADPDDAANLLESAREPVSCFTRFLED